MTATCTINKYPLSNDTNLNSIQLEYRHAYLDIIRWIGSKDYKGSLIVPAGFQLTEDSRLSLLRATETHRKNRLPGVLLFKLPIVKENINNVLDIRMLLD